MFANVDRNTYVIQFRLFFNIFFSKIDVLIDKGLKHLSRTCN